MSHSFNPNTPIPGRWELSEANLSEFETRSTERVSEQPGLNSETLSIEIPLFGSQQRFCKVKDKAEKVLGCNREGEARVNKVTPTLMLFPNYSLASFLFLFFFL